MAGIMDKMMTGDYLAKEPRYANIFYTIMIMLPLFLPAMRRAVFDTPERRKFLFVVYLNVFFSMWATLGYSEPEWLPTFHRTIALISRTAYGMQSSIGDLVLMITSTIVQVLRFPHRFELILFMMACILMPISLTMIVQWIQGWLRRLGDGKALGDTGPAIARLCPGAGGAAAVAILHGAALQQLAVPRHLLFRQLE